MQGGPRPLLIRAVAREQALRPGTCTCEVSVLVVTDASAGSRSSLRSSQRSFRLPCFRLLHEALAARFEHVDDESAPRQFGLARLAFGDSRNPDLTEPRIRQTRRAWFKKI